MDCEPFNPVLIEQFWEIRSQVKIWRSNPVVFCANAQKRIPFGADRKAAKSPGTLEVTVMIN